MAEFYTLTTHIIKAPLWVPVIFWLVKWPLFIGEASRKNT